LELWSGKVKRPKRRAERPLGFELDDLPIHAGELPMFTDEPIEYLSGFKEFLVEQQTKKDDPVLSSLIAEIDRELWKRSTKPTGLRSH
jgi:hypothetical protein